MLATLALCGNVRSASHLGCFDPEEIPNSYWTGALMSPKAAVHMMAKRNIFAPAGNQTLSSL
jgi:hypothetical protein